VQETRQPLPLLANVGDCVAERALRLDIAEPFIDPSLQLGDEGSALALPARKALLDGFARTLGLGVDVERSRVKKYDAVGIKAKRRLAGWDDDYMLRVLGANSPQI
jgi:hypothetical protein